MSAVAEQADYVLLDYKGRYFHIPGRFSEDVKRANQLAVYMAAVEFCCEERQRAENPTTRPEWYERYTETRREYLRLCLRLIPHALQILPPAVPGA